MREEILKMNSDPKMVAADRLLKQIQSQTDYFLVKKFEVGYVEF